MTVNWLPELILLNDYNGDWERYEEALYKFYSKDFIENKPIFENKKLRIKRHPKLKGKDATFWHIIQEGKIEAEKVPNLRRCERIRWPKPIIEHIDNGEIKTWENERRGEKRVCIWLENIEYLVILARRKNFTLFWTAYPTPHSHMKRKLNQEFKSYIKKLAPPA